MAKPRPVAGKIKILCEINPFKKGKTFKVVFKSPIVFSDGSQYRISGSIWMKGIKRNNKLYCKHYAYQIV